MFCPAARRRNKRSSGHEGLAQSVPGKGEGGAGEPAAASQPPRRLRHVVRHLCGDRIARAHLRQHQPVASPVGSSGSLPTVPAAVLRCCVAIFVVFFGRRCVQQQQYLVDPSSAGFVGFWCGECSVQFGVHNDECFRLCRTAAQRVLTTVRCISFVFFGVMIWLLCCSPRSNQPRRTFVQFPIALIALPLLPSCPVVVATPLQHLPLVVVLCCESRKICSSCPARSGLWPRSSSPFPGPRWRNRGSWSRPTRSPSRCR